MRAINQANRAIAIETPLGPDVLGLRKIRVREQLGQPFLIEAELSSNDAAIPFGDIVGHAVVIRADVELAEPRYWHGVVSRIAFVGSKSGYFHYKATIVPWLWALTLHSDCRIFQEKTNPQIVQAVFRDRGARDFELRLSGTYSTREYCVQFRETDFNFVQRLLEAEGIAHYFIHTAERGMMVLADEKAAYELKDHHAALDYDEQGEGDTPNSTAPIVSWEIEHEVEPTLYSVNDYNFKTPRTSLRQVSEVALQTGLNDGKRYDYPGGYDVVAEGERLARTRLQELQSSSRVVRGKAVILTLGAGDLFKLQRHPRDDQNTEYLVTGIDLMIDAGEFGSDQSQSLVRSECQFTAIPSDQPYRPPRTTPRPTVAGAQNAVVVGAAGEEIFTDEHGRVKVQFIWDRDGTADEKSSCWLRVAQSIAGKGWGAFALPRVGHEVLVSFLDGDPDRPIVTGSVYNGANTPPYALPAEKTKSTFKTLTSPDGGGFNELRFEDKSGSEEVFLHAQKDLNVQVKNNRAVTLEGEDHLITTKKSLSLLKDEQHVHVVKNAFSAFDADVNTKVTGNRLGKVDGADHLSVGGDRMVKITGADNLGVGGDLAVKTDGKTSFDVSDLLAKASGGIAFDGGKIHIKAGQTLVLEAGSQLSLKVGGNFVDIGSAGVNIVGSLVGINSGGAAGAGDGCSPLSPAAPEDPTAGEDPPVPENPTAGEKTDAQAEAITRTEGSLEALAAAAASAAPVSEAAAVLDQAAEDGTPFCEECAKEAEAEETSEALDSAVIESITLLEGDEPAADPRQWVNLPSADTWVDTANGVTHKDRLGPKLRFKVTFSAPGAHPFTVKMVPGDDNVTLSEGEKGRNAKFKYQDQVKNYTTDGDGTKIVAGDFFVSGCGLDTFKLVAEDTTNQVEAESGTVTVRRLAYFQVVKMAGTTAPEMAAFRAEYARLGLDFVQLAPADIAAMPNIGSDAESSTYKQRVTVAFGSGPGNAKKPHCVAVGITGYLAVKKPSPELLEMDVPVSGPGAPAPLVPVIALGQGGQRTFASLWKGIVASETWFVSGEFIAADGSSKPLSEALCKPVGAEHNPNDCQDIEVNVSGFPAGGGKIKLRVNVVDRWRNGLSFPGTNIICIAGRVLWNERSAAEMNQTLIHEMGHKVGMVCDGTGTAPDAPAYRYTERGHRGPHCHKGVPLLDSFSRVTSGAECVMFGANVEGRPDSFCEVCSPQVLKMDLSAGLNA